MKKVSIELGGNSYEVRVGDGLLERVGLWLMEKEYSGRAIIITDTTVRDHYADVLSRGLHNAGFKVALLEVPAGERHKTLETAAVLYDKLTGAYTTRAGSSVTWPGSWQPPICGGCP
jgi:3-dehydroquinate synthase